METAVRAILAADGTVSGLVSSRIYPMKLPQGPTMPAITYSRVSGPRVETITGPSGLAHPRVQVDSWASTYAGVKALATAVRKALDGYRGTIASVRVGGIIMDGELDLYEPGVEEYRVTQDYVVWHDETP